MNEEKKMSLEELIKNLDTRYYDDLIERLNNEINNLVFDNQYQEKLEIKEQKLKEVRENRKKIYDTISELQRNSTSMKHKLEDSYLLDLFQDAIKFSNIDMHKREDEAEKYSKLYNDNKKKISKLYTKTQKSIHSETHKISKKMYEHLKSIYKKRVSYEYWPYEENLTTIEQRAKNNKIYGIVDKDKEAIERRYASDIRTRYGISEEELEKLGVNIHLYKNALSIKNGDPNQHMMSDIGDIGRDAIDKMETIKIAISKRLQVKLKDNKILTLQTKYDEIINSAKEIWYLKEMCFAFKDSRINNTKYFNEVQKMIIEQEKKLLNAKLESDKLYEKSGIPEKIRFIDELDKIYNECNELKQKIENLKKENKVEEIELYNSELIELQIQMYKILTINPDLNVDKYNIDIDSVIAKQNELYKQEIKQRQNNTKVVLDSQEPTKIVSEVQEAKVVDSKNEENKLKPNNYFFNPERLALDSENSMLRTIHYQGYMKEKLMGTDLGKLSFSEYLIEVNPQLDKLISIERERETVAYVIYENYLKYLPNDKDMTFEEYASKFYNLDNLDIPKEYAETENKSNRR